MKRIVPEEFDTVIVGRVEKVGFTDRGGPLHRWALVIHIDEQLAGAPLPEMMVLYIHSPVQEFPAHVGEDVRAPDYTKPLIGSRWAWALAVSGTRIMKQRKLFGLTPPTDAQVESLREELKGQ